MTVTIPSFDDSTVPGDSAILLSRMARKSLENGDIQSAQQYLQTVENILHSAMVGTHSTIGNAPLTSPQTEEDHAVHLIQQGYDPDVLAMELERVAAEGDS